MISGNNKPSFNRSSSVRTYYKSIFDKCDMDKDGFVSLPELDNFIRKHEDAQLSQVQLTPLVSNAYLNSDLNHDDKIDFEEFIQMLHNPKFNKDFNNIGQRYIRFIVVPPNRNTEILKRRITCTGLYEDEQKCKITGVGILILSLVQIILFYVNKYGTDSGCISNALMYCPSKKHQIWRYLTYMFVHNDELHLYFNLVVQLAIGIPLEMVHTWRVPVLYCAGVIGGLLFQAVIYPNEALIGASAGVFSFYTAHISTVILNWREMSNPLAHLFIFGIFVIFDAIYSFAKYGNMGSVSYVAHFGGAVCGLLVGIQILRNLKETPIENRIWWLCMIMYILMMGSLIIGCWFVKPAQPVC